MRGIIVLIIASTRQIKPCQLGNDFSELRYEDEIQALNAAAELKPLVVLLHYSVRGNDTCHYIDLLLRENPLGKIVVIAENLAEERILDVLVSGAKGYMEQQDWHKFSNKMLKVVFDGEAWISRKMVAKFLDRLRKNV